MGKPKVLIITGALPYPLVTGAKIRTFNLLKVLAHEFNIELVTVIAGNEDKEYIKKITEADIKCHYLIRGSDESRISKGRDALLSYLLPEPYLTRHYTFKEYRNKLNGLLFDSDYDVIHCDSISMTGNLCGLDKSRLILTQHNIEQNIWAGYLEHASSFPARLFYRNQYRKVKHLEANLDKTYGHVVTVSEEDRRMLAADFPDDRIIVAENGVDPDAYQNKMSEDKRSGIIFAGSLDWHPNIDGLTWFVQEIYQELVKIAPQSSTTIVGRRPSQGLAATLSGNSRIALHADVPEIQPYLHAARVMMVPLRIGGGSRLKILEAMAAGVPVVSTSKGAEGLAVTDGKDIIIEDNPKQYAEALVKVLQDNQMYRQLIQNGRELIEGRYSWEKVARPLAQLWKKVADA
jgi:glycosyltransferase involved in cell wall biosynthesis